MDFDDPSIGLAMSVVLRAIEDWYYLIDTKAWLDKYQIHHGEVVSFDELRTFFNGKMLNPAPKRLGMSGKQMLKILEDELLSARKEAGR